jgi:hypothetical protein
VRRELGRIDEDGNHDPIGAAFGQAHQRQMARVQRPMVGTSATVSPLPRARQTQARSAGSIRIVCGLGFFSLGFWS